MADVILDHVSKNYGTRLAAVQDLSLIIPHGEFLVLVGPSGSGKTTILRLIAGLEKPTQGSITIGQRVVNKVCPKDRDIAMVFQNYALYPHMSVYDNLAFGLSMRTVPGQEIANRVHHVAQVLGITEILSRRPNTLSGGQRQRVAMGRAMVRKPAVFLFDEPLSNLDANMRADMRRELHELHQRLDATMIYVTHDQAEAMTLGDRICVMDHGVLQQVDTPARVYQQPANLFVARFIGTPPMNLFPGILISQNGTLHFQAEALSLPLPHPLASILSPHTGKSIQLGLRPRSFTFARNSASPQPSAQPFPVKILFHELLGDEKLLHVRLGALTFSILCPASVTDLSPNSELLLYPDWHQAHVFDAATGINLMARITLDSPAPLF